MLASQRFWRRLRHLSADGNGNATKRRLWKIVSVLDQRNKLRQLHTPVALLQKLPRITAIRGKLLLLQSRKPACSSLLIHIERQPHSQLRLLTVVPKQGQSETHHCSSFDFQIRRPMHSCPHRYAIYLCLVYTSNAVCHMCTQWVWVKQNMTHLLVTAGGIQQRTGCAAATRGH